MRLARFIIVAVFAASLASLHAQKPLKPKQLPSYYRQWIEEDAAYIITQDERRAYLSLRTNEARDNFIQQFWESRNPTPHSPVNDFKEEHYRRLAYVRTHFGDERYDDGWRTDMGRIYITLGPPQQTAKYHEGMYTHPIEIWFYQAPSPALPPYFNIVFYKPSVSDDWKLYSPVFDGPSKIVTNDQHDDAQALKYIRDSIGAEGARDMLSLLPNEPVSLDHPQPTMLSDSLLDEIKSLPDQKLEHDRIMRLRATNSEHVTTRIFGAQSAELQTVVLRDDQGRSTVHYIVRNAQPDPGLIGALPGGHTGYSVSMTARLSTAAGKAVYERTEQLSGSVSAAGADAGRQKIFAAEGLLPLAPGSYHLEVTLTNNLTRFSTRTAGLVSVPAHQPGALQLSGLLAYRDHPGPASPGMPFTVAGIRFDPLGEQVADISAGERLPLVYQVWLPASDTLNVKGVERSLHMHYAVGSIGDPAIAAHRIEEDETIAVRNVDPAGNLTTGHTVDTSALAPGTYRVALRITEEGSDHTASMGMTLHILPHSEPAQMWSAFGDPAQHPGWQEDLLRGISAEAQGDKDAAIDAYKRSLAAKPDAADSRHRLDALQARVTQPALAR